MHADQLRVAVDNVVNVLAASGVLTAIREYRTAKGDQRPVASARLGHAGGKLMEQWASATAPEKLVLKMLHIDSLCDAAYWKDLLSPAKAEKERTTELVHLYSRVLFASNHLPNFSALVSRVDTSAASSQTPAPAALQSGESRLSIRLTDAGEKASDPDRIARSIDGIDMLYSACASLSRRPAIDLRLDNISGKEERLIMFTGEAEGVSAMAGVIDSIPEALADLYEDQEIDLNAVVQSLPIFKQLDTLAGHGVFSENDLRDIRETMHQGALLTLESGVMLVESQQAASKAVKTSNAEASSLAKTNNAKSTAAAAAVIAARKAAQAAAEKPQDKDDEHFEHYMQEKAAMQSGQNTALKSGATEPFPMMGKIDVEAPPSEADKEAAVEELLKTLNRQRDG